MALRGGACGLVGAEAGFSAGRQRGGRHDEGAGASSNNKIWAVCSTGYTGKLGHDEPCPRKTSPPYVPHEKKLALLRKWMAEHTITLAHAGINIFKV